MDEMKKKFPKGRPYGYTACTMCKTYQQYKPLYTYFVSPPVQQKTSHRLCTHTHTYITSLPNLPIYPKYVPVPESPFLSPTRDISSCHIPCLYRKTPMPCFENSRREMETTPIKHLCPH